VKNRLRHRNSFRRRRRLLLAVAGLIFIAGLYILALLVSPRFITPLSLDKFQALDATKVPIGEHQVIIPKIGVNI